MIERKDSMSIRLCRIFSTLFTSNSLYLFLIYSGDYAGFNDMWSFLNSRFFCLLDASYIESVDTFWNSLRKLYVVTSMKRGKTEEVILVAVFNDRSQISSRIIVLMFCHHREKARRMMIGDGGVHFLSYATLNRIAILCNTFRNRGKNR